MRNRALLFIVIGFCSLLMVGCAGKAGSYQALLNKIPQAEVDDFQYSRGGVWTSATMQVTGGQKEANYIKFDRVQINLNYWFERISIMMSGYKRYFKAEDP